jgi:pimeloyl-ACP methyl ester carboxylesterase
MNVTRLAVETADLRNINVVQIGRGRDTLVLVHGLGENLHSWGELPEDITASHTIVAVDLRGHGDSDWDPRGEYHLDKFVSDLTTIIDRLAIRTFTIAGHSLGANIALEIACLRRSQVQKLVLVEFKLDDTADEVRKFAMEQFAAQFRVHDSLSAYNALLQQQRPLADPAALLHYSNNSVRPQPGGGYQVKCDPALRHFYDSTERNGAQQRRIAIARLSCPFLLVRGSGSALVPPAAAREIVKLAPHAQLSLVKGAGHAVMLDRPQEFNDAMARFLEAPARRSRHCE